MAPSRRELDEGVRAQQRPPRRPRRPPQQTRLSSGCAPSISYTSPARLDASHEACGRCCCGRGRDSRAVHAAAAHNARRVSGALRRNWTSVCMEGVYHDPPLPLRPEQLGVDGHGQRDARLGELGRRRRVFDLLPKQSPVDGARFGL